MEASNEQNVEGVAGSKEPNEAVEVQLDVNGMGMVGLLVPAVSISGLRPDKLVNVAVVDARYIIPPIAASQVRAVIAVSGGEPHSVVGVEYHVPK